MLNSHIYFSVGFFNHPLSPWGEVSPRICSRAITLYNFYITSWSDFTPSWFKWSLYADDIQLYMKHWLNLLFLKLIMDHNFLLVHHHSSAIFQLISPVKLLAPTSNHQVAIKTSLIFVIFNYSLSFQPYINLINSIILSYTLHHPCFIPSSIWMTLKLLFTDSLHHNFITIMPSPLVYLPALFPYYNIFKTPLLEFWLIPRALLVSPQFYTASPGFLCLSSMGGRSFSVVASKP